MSDTKMHEIKAGMSGSDVASNLYTDLTYLESKVNVASDIIQELPKSVKHVSSPDELNAVTLSGFTTGDFVYCDSNNRYYRLGEGGDWEKAIILYIGDSAPADESQLWYDTSDSYESLASDDDTLSIINATLHDLQERLETLEQIPKTGIIPDKITNSERVEIATSAEAEAPSGVTTSGETIESTEERPDTDGTTTTVKAVCAKCGLQSVFATNAKELINGELCFFTDTTESNRRLAVYYGGTFYPVALKGEGGSSSSGSGGGSSSGSLSLDALYDSVLEYLVFTNGSTPTKIFVDDNNQLRVREINKTARLVGDLDSTWKNYVSGLLCINEVYCGGVDSTGEADVSEDKLCTHNFVELANASDNDINLKGCYLLYTDGSKRNESDNGVNWQELPLEGIIKAGSTFLIRGAKCNTSKTAIIDVDTYDMEWNKRQTVSGIWTETNIPLAFQQGTASFFLCVGSTDLTDSLIQLNNKENKLSNPWSSKSILLGYIDSCGFGTGSFPEGSSVYLVKDSKSQVIANWDNVLFARWYMLEPAKQGNKEYSKRTTTGLWTHIFLDRQTSHIGDSSIQYYYDDQLKRKYTPQASYMNKNFFNIKTTFTDKEPNMVNITFGRQATAKGDGTDASNGATRCFNWVSVGNYDEFVEIRKVDSETWSKYYSITENNKDNSDAINTYIEFYKRLRWMSPDGQWVTTHKAIVSGFVKGEYEYRIGRDRDKLYLSDVMTFTVVADDDVKSFSYIQTTDQQGFNWVEYQAWKKTAYWILNNEKNYNFTINTGDITQSGNRPSEWLDYYDGRQYLRDKEEMFSIGNNDLCGHEYTKLTDGNDATSKYNHINVLRYFCFELDPENVSYVETTDEATYVTFDTLPNATSTSEGYVQVGDVKYKKVNNHFFDWSPNLDNSYENIPIYSTYSFNYGNYHFVSLNSEMAQASSKMYYNWLMLSDAGDKTCAQTSNAKIEDWLKKDLQIWKGLNDSDEISGCSKCIVYMHEMPFTIVTWDYLAKSSERNGSHLNYLNSNGNYRFSRLFKKYGIRLVMGGHKHTYSISKPIYDAPDLYITDNAKNENIDFLGGAVNASLAKMPVIQVTDESQILTSSDYTNFARYEVVSKFDAPTYVMCQASGYKLVSNKEQPSGSQYTIPWLLSYFKAKTSAASPKENYLQHYPMYIRYDLTEDSITVTAKQVGNIWVHDAEETKATYDFNQQNTNIFAKAMTLSQVTDADASIYSSSDTTNKESYLISL